MSLAWAGFGFLRPAWLLALVLLPLLAWAWRRRAGRRNAWRTAVDEHLLPHLIDDRGPGGRKSLEGLAVLGGLALVVLALAGPSWRAVEQPLQAGGQALVVALELSSATTAADLQPSRLVQARARIGALLEAHPGDAGLVVYADDAFVVSPLTPDAANVAVFLDALAPDIMPVDGQRPGRAIDLAVELLQQAGAARGEILLLAPEAGPGAALAAARAASEGYRVSVLAMGTPTGAGYRDREGGIRRSALQPEGLRSLARAGGGRVHDWNVEPTELVAAMDGGAPARDDGAAGSGGGMVAEDGGFWLLPPAMFLLLWAFRRGGVLALLVLGLALPLPQARADGADAPDAADAAPAAGLWHRADQAAHARSVEAEAAYRRGDFPAAARAFAGLPGADAAYNRGNALARAGRYEEAIAAYDQALRETPGMADALANRAAVEAAMRREPPPGAGAGGDRPPDTGQDGRGTGTDESERGDEGRTPPDDDAGRTPDDGGTPPPDPPPGRDADAPGTESEGGDPADTGRQETADQAQREAMQRALENAGEAAQHQAPAVRDGTTADQEREAANAAWLRRVPDDPGALLRARFRNEHLRRRAGER